MLTGDKDLIRRDRAALVAELAALGVAVRGSACCCPFHGDSNPSASIYAGDDGAWRLKCHVPSCGFCGDVFDVKAKAENRPVAEVLKGSSDRPAAPKKAPKVHVTRAALEAAACWDGDAPPLRIEATYRYTDPATGRVDLEVFRLLRPDGSKTFKQAVPVDGGWILRGPTGLWPLYNRTRVQSAKVIIAGEGEKVVHSLTAVLPDGFAAATSPGGAKNAKRADWSPLAGKTVYVWPDADADGCRYADDVVELLQRLDPPAEVHRLDPAALGLTAAGDDAVDYLERFGGDTAESRRDALDVALATAEPVSATADLYRRIEDAAAGRYAAVELPGCPTLHRLAQPLLPGTLTVLAGDPGDGKSFLALQWCLDLHRAGVPVAVYELEEDRAFWLTRAMAMLAGEGELTRADWVKGHAAEARAAYQRHKAELDRFAPRLEVAGDRQVTHAELAAWVKARAAAGCRVIVVDPTTALAAGAQPWIEDLRLVTELKTIARQSGCSIVLVTHPRIRRGGKGGPPALDDIAGGAAFPRFAQTVLWVRRHQYGRDCRWSSPLGGDSYGRVNRSIRVSKARNGPGGGVEVAAEFDGRALRFIERGPIVGDGAGADE
jgi:KaiC/GvpD/RAD55 family RecA-like ATPase